MATNLSDLEAALKTATDEQTTAKQNFDDAKSALVNSSAYLILDKLRQTEENGKACVNIIGVSAPDPMAFRFTDSGVVAETNGHKYWIDGGSAGGTLWSDSTADTEHTNSVAQVNGEMDALASLNSTLTTKNNAYNLALKNLHDFSSSALGQSQIAAQQTFWQQWGTIIEVVIILGAFLGFITILVNEFKKKKSKKGKEPGSQKEKEAEPEEKI